jgi:hypothetical protein
MRETELGTILPEPHDLPEWLPDIIRVLALETPLRERQQKLLTDERMKNVWKVIRKETVRIENVRPAVHNFQKYLGLLKNKGDAACLVFFDLIYFEPWADQEIVELPFLEDLTKSRNAIEELKHHQKYSKMDQELSQSYAKVISDLEQRLVFEESIASRFSVPRSAKARGDDAVRVYGRAIGRAMIELYGTPLYGTAATVVSIVSGASVSAKKMENWTKAVR